MDRRLMCETPDKHQLIHVAGGFTVIYGQDGTRIGDKLAPDQDSIVYADSDLAMIPVAKATADPTGHYARPRRCPAFVQSVGACVSGYFPA
jgi:nitrilase